MKRIFYLDEYTSIEQDRGVWYIFTWELTPSFRKNNNDQYLKVYCHRKRTRVSFPDEQNYAATKRQLHQRDLKKYQIHNEHIEV